MGSTQKKTKKHLSKKLNRQDSSDIPSDYELDMANMLADTCLQFHPADTEQQRCDRCKFSS